MSKTTQTPYHWNLVELGDLLGMHRETVAKRIKDYGVPHVATAGKGRVRLYLFAQVMDAIALHDKRDNQYWLNRMTVIWRKEIFMEQNGQVTLEDLEDLRR